MLRARIIALALVVGACSSDDPCLTSSACPANMRCALERGQTGVCVACDEEETPYDGEDNDCLSTTPDSDLDGDGDNWRGAPISAGGDCDDGDPTVSSKLVEVCRDEKDNDCDGDVDEADCAPQAAPIVRISSPPDGAVVRGTLDFVITASDDIGLDSVVLVGPRGVQLGSRRESPFRFTVDTTPIDDGPGLFEASATDVAGIRSLHRVNLRVDNETGPTIEVRAGPVGGTRYGGDLVFDLAASDPSGVASITIEIDGLRVATSSTSTLAARWDSRGLQDGLHDLVIRAVDAFGAERVDTWTVRLDNTPPLVAFVTPVEGATVAATFAVEATATDPSGVLSMSLDTLRSTGTPLAGMLTLPPGLHTLTASAADVVTVDGTLRGNVGTQRVTVWVAP